MTVARKMLRPAERLVVVVPPSVMGERLRAAITHVAEAAGIAFIEHGGSERGALAGDDGALLVTDNPAELNPEEVGRAVVFAADPATIAAEAARRHGVSPLEGLWHGARCLAQTQAFASRTGAPIIAHDQLLADPLAALMAGLDALGAPGRRRERARAAKRFTVIDAERAASPFPFGGALDFYRDGLVKAGRPAWWDRALFRCGDQPDKSCPPVMDITGRGRILLFGPLIALPPGRWRATMRFSLCADAARNPFLAQFAASEATAELRVRPSGPGTFEVTLDHRWDAVQPVELRLWTARAVFHGEMRFAGAAVEFLG